MAIDSTPAVVSVSPPVAALVSEPASDDARWVAWKAKGAAHDLAVRRKLKVAVPTLVVVAAIVMYGLSGG